MSGELEVALPDYRLEKALIGWQIYMADLPNRRFSTQERVLREFMAERPKGIGELPERMPAPARAADV
ncbi:hypothetical protein LMG27177_03358 [Paraburkholderia fynbosensis]|uniref:Uncharacterized protein n=1 Tax=Paraburkholderia fynbosensis TaxID=1200993 RepID=A0A6J5G4L8_9BURK|nr:hypothetical protein LMG27177_03358 [Paraburkholderia fynbosensis]